MKRKSLSIWMIIAGAVLLMAALLLLLYNRNENIAASEMSAEAVSAIEDVIKEKAKETEETAELGATKDNEKTNVNETTDPIQTHSTAESTVNINGYDYIGYLVIPKLELELPVMSTLDYGRLAVAPCRQSGSAVSDDMVIAAHNFAGHFGKLNQLDAGDEIIFTDMDGIENLYHVEVSGTVAADAVEAVVDSGYDLVLYTCTKGGRSRVAVFCSR